MRRRPEAAASFSSSRPPARGRRGPDAPRASAGWLHTATLLMAVAACSRTPSEPTPSSRAAPAASPAPPEPQASAAPVDEPIERLPAPARLVAIGDLHGDLSATRAALRLAGAINHEDDWIGGQLVVVQTGDQLDRGDDDRAITDLLQRLAARARQSGGALIILNGNHETMNVAGDFRYATAGANRAFADAETAGRSGPQLQAYPESLRGRAAAFSPGARYADLLGERPVVAIVGDTVFVHAGLLPEHVEYGVARINQEVSRWMQGSRPMPAVISSDDAPVWTRLYGGPQLSAETCRTLQAVLERLGVARMVVGHTVQSDGITAACDGRVYRIDVGLSRYYGHNPPQVLEITAQGPRVLRATSSEDAEPRPAPRAPAKPRSRPSQPSAPPP